VLHEVKLELGRSPLGIVGTEASWLFLPCLRSWFKNLVENRNIH